MQLTKKNLVCGSISLATVVIATAIFNHASAQTGKPVTEAAANPDTRPSVGQPGEAFHQAMIREASPFGLLEAHQDQASWAPFQTKKRELLSAYHSAQDDAQKKSLAEEITLLAGQEFDARQDARNRELTRLEDELKRLRSLHTRRAKEKEEIVRDHIRHMLREADGLGWGTEDSPYTKSSTKERARARETPPKPVEVQKQ